jgi:hypothetical protein
MVENPTGAKKRGRKKGSVATSKPSGKRIPRNLESLSFEQLQELNVRVSTLMKSKKDEQIKQLRSRLEELEKL